MKKTIEVTKTVKQWEYYCDVCGSKMDYLDMKFCDVCSKHLCTKCRIRSEDEFGGESPSFYCRMCWDIGSVYRGEIEDEFERHRNVVSILELRWKRAAIKYGFDKKEQR